MPPTTFVVADDVQAVPPYETSVTLMDSFCQSQSTAKLGQTYPHRTLDDTSCGEEQSISNSQSVPW